MHKNQRGFGAIEILIAIVLIVALVAIGLNTWTKISTEQKKKETNQSPSIQLIERQDIKSRAGLTNEVSDLPSSLRTFATEAKSKFIEKIGQDVYINNYRIDIDRSIECANAPANQSKCVAFLYLPPSEYGLRDTFIFARVIDGTLAFKGQTENCVKTPSSCLFNISPAQAQKIMSEAGYTISGKLYLEVDEQRAPGAFYTEWWWKAGIPSKEHPDPECSYQEYVEVRVSDGVLTKDQDEVCA